MRAAEADIFYITDKDNNHLSFAPEAAEMRTLEREICIHFGQECLYYSLPANKKGIEDAKVIIAGLQSWIDCIEKENILR